MYALFTELSIGFFQLFFAIRRFEAAILLRMMIRRLEGKVALVTGASRGIGRATALLFAREGAQVAINYAKSRQQASEVVDSIQNDGGRALAIQASVAGKSEVISMVETILREFGKIDILVNNAGVLHRGNTLALDEKKLDEMLEINVKGIIYCVQATAPHMVERRYGKIVNLSSVAALGTAVPETTPYALTKAAVIAFTKRLAFELGPHGINVNAICPGFIRTEMAMAGSPDEVQTRLNTMAQKTMLGRVGEVGDVARAALFLAGDEASFVTAQVLTVDGGRTDFLSYST